MLVSQVACITLIQMPMGDKYRSNFSVIHICMDTNTIEIKYEQGFNLYSLWVAFIKSILHLIVILAGSLKKSYFDHAEHSI